MNEFFYEDTVSRTISSCSGWSCTNDCVGGPLAIWEPENIPATSTPYCTAFYAQIQASDAGVNQQIASSEKSASQQHLATSMMSMMGVTAAHPTTTGTPTTTATTTAKVVVPAATA